MKKNVVQDIIPPKKTIRNVELPSRSRKLPEKVQLEKIIEEVPMPVAPVKPKIFIKKVDEILPPPALKIEKTEPLAAVPSYKYEYDVPRRSSRRFLYITVGLFLIAAGFGVSAFFKGAEIKITPKHETKALNETFTAKKDATTGLGYQLVTITKDVEKAVEATSEQKVDKKATGRIVIYNNAGPAPQSLIATTRFQTEEGLIFRLINNAVVPGRTTKDGKTVAGSLEVVVEADKPGESYNIGLKDFTIPGFKGDPKYTQVYARSKTPMSGGFSGMQKVVSKDIMDGSESALEAELRASLSKDITSQIPANFVLYPESLSYKFDPVTSGNGTNGGALIKKRGVANAIIVDKGSLSRAIMAKLLPQATDDVVKIVNLDKFEFSFVDPGAFNPNVSMSATFNLKGNPEFVWVVDENKLKTDLLGLSKKSAKTVIGTYPNITEAWVETHPFWNQTIPKDPESVKLINTLTK